MKKICLVVAGLYISLLSAFSQSVPKKDSSQYKSRELKIEEVNLVSSYYHQTGNNAAVTGGTGSEKLSDFANGIDIKLTRYDKKYRLHTITADLGVDTYTSASSDMIDSKANSSASSHDIRVYPSVSWAMGNEKTGNTVGLNASASKEFDYFSTGFGVSFMKKSKDNSREFGVKAQAYLDKVSLIAPVELRTININGGRRGEHDYATTPRNTFSGSFSLSQIVNQRFQLMLLLDIACQQGYLGLPFHRVYFNDNSLKAESLPNNRFKIPAGIRANYFIGDKIILRSYYRFYYDDWGLTAHTAELETVFKITPFFSVSPFYRYYTQTGVNYFAPYLVHTTTDTYYTSNYDLSRFNSHFIGAGLRFAPPKGLSGNPHIGMIELRYGHYTRSNSLNSDIITMNLKFK
jgi:Protein of unknown function (DUF3570)